MKRGLEERRAINISINLLLFYLLPFKELFIILYSLFIQLVSMAYL